MRSITRDGPGIWNRVFDITSKGLIFTNMIQYTIMCTRLQFRGKILDILVDITDCCFLGGYWMKRVVHVSPVSAFLCFKAVLQL